MRQIVLDTETTGLEWKKGNRVVEIGCVELVERRPTGRTYHQYIHPERRSEEHTSELQSLMRISYAVFCLQKNNKHNQPPSYKQPATTPNNPPSTRVTIMK